MCAEVGKVYKEIGGDRMLVLRDVPANEVGQIYDGKFDYVEVVFANNHNMSNGWRRKQDGKYPMYATWPQHPQHLIITKETTK